MGRAEMNAKGLECGVGVKLRAFFLFCCLGLIDYEYQSLYSLYSTWRGWYVDGVLVLLA